LVLYRTTVRFIVKLHSDWFLRAEDVGNRPKDSAERKDFPRILFPSRLVIPMWGATDCRSPHRKPGGASR
jgi:hypothetical protein